MGKKAKKIQVVLNMPKTEKENQALQAALDRAYTSLVLSIIERRHKNSAEKKEAYAYLRKPNAES